MSTVLVTDVSSKLSGVFQGKTDFYGSLTLLINDASLGDVISKTILIFLFVFHMPQIGSEMRKFSLSLVSLAAFPLHYCAK